MPKIQNMNVASDSLVGARKLKAVTPHATNDLPDGIADALWINDTGVVAVAVKAEDESGYIVMKVNGPGPLDVRAKAVRVTGTTATDIVAMY